jgi:hypothetical protein
MKRKALAFALIFALLFSALAGLTPFGLKANFIFPMAEIEILSPLNNETYLTNRVFLKFTVATTIGNVSPSYNGTPSIQCYVDGKLYQQINLTDLTDGRVKDLSLNFSIILSGLNPGQHNVFVTMTHRINTFLGVNYDENVSSRVVYFSVPSPPRISLMSPQNQSYRTANIPVNFAACADYGAVSWMGYSLDGQDNVTITGNTTLTGLSEGAHNITFYAADIYGNTGASETIHFAIEPFPTDLVIASVAGIAVGAVGLLFYFRKRKMKSGITHA